MSQSHCVSEPLGLAAPALLPLCLRASVSCCFCVSEPLCLRASVSGCLQVAELTVPVLVELKQQISTNSDKIYRNTIHRYEVSYFDRFYCYLWLSPGVSTRLTPSSFPPHCLIVHSINSSLLDCPQHVSTSVSPLSVSHTHTLHYNCCYHDIKGTQDFKICSSHVDSLYEGLYLCVTT